jgi:uncharacterized protein YjeT (DUF2065 family)
MVRALAIAALALVAVAVGVILHTVPRRWRAGI